MNRWVVFISSILLGLAAVCQAEPVISPGRWYNEVLTFEPQDSWTVESCFKSHQLMRVEYHFESAMPVNFNFHAHPELENGVHTTVKIDRVAKVARHSSEANTELPGLYCFDFFPSKPLGLARQLTLRYRAL
ncbi:hypothetical protein P886_4717 [Alteromonadaceae bacterium 2753L.S.0a.02]|nr:hypothetical protein P886_4717 [Alteromonadaceae bacterium 2753L.S.0a.02]